MIAASAGGPPPGGPARLAGGRSAGRAALLSAEFGLIVLLLVFGVGFAVATNGFLSTFSVFAMTRSGAVNVLVGLAMMSVIVTGGLDLSLGAIGVCAGVAAGWLMQIGAAAPGAACLAALLLGAALGTINGVLIVRSRIHSFIVTLATMSIFFGAMIVMTRAQPYSTLPDSFLMLGRSRLWHGISPMLAGAVAVGGLLLLLYRCTKLGREMLAAGANPRAALLSGIDVRRTVVLCHALAGLIAAVAGILLTARNGAAIPGMAGNLGQDWLLPAFLGPVLGGCLLAGGRVSVTGAVLGGLLVTVLNSGLLLLHVGEFWVQFFLGVLLLGAVTLDRLRRRLILGLA